MIADLFATMFAGITFDGTNPRDPAIAKILGLGRQSSAGVDVDHVKVMALPAVKRAVEIITNKIFGMPWYVFEEHEEGRLFDKQHPSWRCVTSRANVELDDATVRQQLTQWALMFGNGCAAIVRPPGWPASSEPVELIPLMPDVTSLIRIGDKAAEAIGDLSLKGQLRYKTEIGGDTVLLEKSEVLHIKGLGPNPYWGWDVVTLLLEAFGGVIAKEQYSNRFFGQGATPAGFIEHESELDEEEEERFISSVSKAIHGLGKAHKMILLENGMKFKQVTIDPQKSQMLEGRQFDVRTVSMAIGIKPHKLIDGANSAFASLEQANQEHKDDDILPWVNKWRKEMNTKLLTAEQLESGSHSIDVDDEELEWVPFSERAKGCVELYNNGVIDKDETRRKVNFGPSKSRRSKQYRIPANIVYEDDQAIAIQTADPSTTPADDGKPVDEESRLRQFVLHKAEVRLLNNAARKAAKGSGVFLDWLDEVKPDPHPDNVQQDVDAMHAKVIGSLSQIADTAINDEQLLEMIKTLEARK